MTQGRVCTRRISSTSFDCDFAVAVLVEVLHAAPPRDCPLVALVDLGRVQLGKLIEFRQSLVGALGFFFIDAADGESHVNENVVSNDVSGTYSRQASRTTPPNCTRAMCIPFDGKVSTTFLESRDTSLDPLHPRDAGAHACFGAMIDPMILCALSRRAKRERLSAAGVAAATDKGERYAGAETFVNTDGERVVVSPMRLILRKVFLYAALRDRCVFWSSHCDKGNV